MIADILHRLDRYSPLLAGTMPLGVHIDTSDVDVICHAPDLDAFAVHVTQYFSGEPLFRIVRAPIHVIASFMREGTRIEIYGESRPVYEQNAFRHMLVEARLLRLGGDALKQRVRARKLAGDGTELAFARVLHLDLNEPFGALLALDGVSDAELRRLVEAT